MSQENKSLITLVSESTKIETMLLESQGEITPDIEEALAVSAEALSEKVDAYSLILDRFKALEGYYKEKADQYNSISKQCKNVQERLKNNLKYAMEQLGTNELVGQDMRFVKKPTTGTLNIIDEDLIPVEYKREVITTEIDKKKLKEDAKTKEIPGVEFIQTYSLNPYANTKQITSKGGK